MQPFAFKNLSQQFTAAIGHQVVLGELCCGVDQAGELDDLFDGIQIPPQTLAGGLKRAHEVNGHRLSSLLSLLRVHGEAELAHPRGAIFFGNVPTQINHLTTDAKGLVGSGGSGHGGKGDLELIQLGVNAHDGVEVLGLGVRLGSIV